MVVGTGHTLTHAEMQLFGVESPFRVTELVIRDSDVVFMRKNGC